MPWERGEDVCAAHRVNLPVNVALNKASSIGETSKIEDWGACGAELDGRSLLGTVRHWRSVRFSGGVRSVLGGLLEGLF